MKVEQKQKTTNPLQTLWGRRPRAMWAMVLALAVIALFASPLFLHVTRIFPLANVRPKSALWLTSTLATFTAMGLLVSRWRSWGASLVVFAVCLSLSLLAVEIPLRIWPPYEVAGVRTWVEPDFSKNSWGFSDHEPNYEADQRVLLLGDSIAKGCGDGVGQDTRFGDLAEQRLVDEGWDVDVQVVAIGNTQFDEYLKNYRQLAPKYDPRVVVVSWCLNDIEYGEFSRAQSRTAASSAKGTLRDLLRGFAKQTKINEWFLWTVLSNRCSLLARQFGWIEEDWLDKHNRVYMDGLISSYQKPAAVDQVRQDFRWLAADCQEHNRELLVVIFPFEFHLLSERDDEVQTMKRILTDVGVRYVDLYPAYLEAGREKRIFSYKDACHPNDTGHRIATDLLVESLLPLLQVDSSD